jgi:hypothetical protein
MTELRCKKLSDADLKELGVSSLGHRKRLLEAIGERTAPMPSPAPEARGPRGGKKRRNGVALRRHLWTSRQATVSLMKRSAAATAAAALLVKTPPSAAK